MISGVRAGFSASLSGCFCSAMRSLSADDSVHNRRAAALPFASLVVHWASTSLLPALRALGFALPGAEKRRTAAFFLSVRNRRAAAFSLASLVAHWASASLLPALRALGFAPFESQPSSCTTKHPCKAWVLSCGAEGGIRTHVTFPPN